MYWPLQFRESQPLKVDACEQALAAFVGGPVETERPRFIGNPRDGYGRTVTVTAPCPARNATLVLSLHQEGWSDEEDPAALATLGTLRLEGATASFATKYAAWQELRGVFAALGCADQTLISYPAQIVDDAVAAGETAIAARLRSEITTALIAHAKAQSHYEVRLGWTRADDIEAVLEAYDPARIVFMHLSGCGLSALPRAFARFPAIEILDLDHNPIDASVLRISLPKLYMMSLQRCPIASLQRDDLAGFPALRNLTVSNAPLRELDARIIDVCPQLGSLDIRGTPLANDDAQLTALRARWPNMKLLSRDL
jgi:hypothetical protein